MSRAVDTCPNCGALVTPQLSRCRQCKHYLHGTQFEGFLFEHLLPARFAASPGTGIFLIANVLYYVLMSVLAGFQNALGFSGYSRIQLGALFGPGIWEGEYWRFVTSMLAHGDLIHLAFNLYALTVVGPLIEELFDRKKMMLVYLVSGILSMVASYVFHVEISGGLGNSVGASGAVSGLIGACLIGARRRGPDGRQVAQVMLRWTVYMAIFGFLVSGIDNAAHAGGWLVGAGLAAVIPLGIVQKRSVQMALSFAVLGLLGAVVLSVGLMLAQARGMPLSFERSAYPGRLFFFTYRPPVDWDVSDEAMAFQDCQSRLKRLYAPEDGTEPTTPQQAVTQCRIATRAVPVHQSYQLLAAAYEAANDPNRAEEALRIAHRLGRR